MSRISSRAGTVAAALAIVLLVVLLVILWTGVRNGSIDRYGRNNSDIRLLGTMESVKGTTETIEENMTNEVFQKEEKDVVKQNDSAIEKRLFRKGGDLEFVRPLKISQNQYEDPLDEFSTAKRHHSGHFRQSTAEVWDPHPQYEFTAFGRQFRLRLAHDSSFISPNIKITHMGENTTRREHPGYQLGCHYSGTVNDDPHSAVTVSLCHGMTGHMRTSTGSYIIKPAEQWQGNGKDSLESLPHAIQRMPTPPSNSDRSNDPEVLPGSRNCGVIDYDTNDAPAPLTDDASSNIYVGGRSREKRSLTDKTSLDYSREKVGYEQFVGHSEHHRRFLRNDGRYERYYSVERRRNYASEESGQDSEMESDPFVTWRPRRALPREYFIEIMVAADAKMVKYHGDGLINYIFVLMSTVSRIYKDQSIGNPISIAVTHIIPIDEVFGMRVTGNEGIAAADMLKKFCNWQKRQNPDEPSSTHHDAALLLTRENLCHNPDEMRCDTLGLAELGRMCIPGSSCAIVQDNGLAAAFTIAHEIGHVLNMPHDDDTKCSRFRNGSGMHNVMSRMLDENTFPWEWSKCSRHYVTDFLEAGNGKCLLDKPTKLLERDNLTRLPGEDFSENKQCELVFGPGASICPHMVSDVCRRLWCTAPMWDRYQQCHTQHMPWADGTPCGSGRWCHRGECVSRRSLRPIDGQWGAWERYGECSRTCGGGVKKRERKCDNPPPQNGGNYCVGERVKYRSCGTRECPVGSPDFREQQCSQYDNNNLNIQNLARDVKWHAKYTRILPQDRCKLYCQVESNQYYMLQEKVVDGTPCGPDTFHVCVNGQCKPAGCDHSLNSNAVLDTCGVCRGDNSTCQRITGSYNSSAYGYNMVTRIPSGSSYIDIRQHGWMGSQNDSNYLALRLESGEYILNGNFVVMHRKVIVHPAVTMEYSGPAPVIERLNSSRPISTDLILEVLSVGHLYPPQIMFEYTVPKRILKSYTWILSDWSNCSHACQGTKYRKAECRSTENKDVVSDAYCREEERPREESQICNSHCILKWQIIPMSECSTHCGPGHITVTSHCLQVHLNSRHKPRQLPAHACSHIERPGDQQPCVGPCKDAHWTYESWEACSVSCGGGIQVRTAICVDSDGREVLEKNCLGQEKHVKRICGQDVCPKWFLGEWSQCSVSCGVGKRHRSYWCHVENSVVANSYCGDSPSGVTKVCDAGPCQQWQAGDWSPCSVTCGEGVSVREVVCKTANESISDECPLSEKPHHEKKCVLESCRNKDMLPIIYTANMQDDINVRNNEIDDIVFRSGYEWNAEPYRECSKRCINGFVNRTVKCTSVEKTMIVPDDYCDRKKKPPSRIPCNRHRCPMWNTGDWSHCNVECGTGVQFRQVRCQSPRGDALQDEDCLDDEKPDVSKICEKNPCVTSARDERRYRLEPNIMRRWKTSNWTRCSKSFGSGVQRRRVECTMRRGNHGPEVPVQDAQCELLGLARPRSQKVCHRVACDFVWQEGPWSECSAECGDGIQRREVTCHRVNPYEWIDLTPSESGCSMDQKPPTTQRCKVRDCDDKYHWTPGPWKKCSHMCGRKGRQMRRVICTDRNGQKVRRNNCRGELKPPRKQKCNQRKCGPVSCAEVQKRLKTTRDGEYSLVVGGKTMPIYCHGMSTAEPKEYLTLPAGGEENYAEIYDKRLNDPQSCPYNGQRNDSCDCDTIPTNTGKTMFRRVRIDPVRLYIIENEYTFSWTEGATRVEYGKAGDCYSRIECPQGRFSINLSGTQLKLSPDVSWIADPPWTKSEIKKISNQHIVGKCGGYCGFCKPKTGLKLDVLPP